MKATIHITLKPGVLDPQGKAIESALHTLGFHEASEVRQGKCIELDIDAPSRAEAEKRVDAMCRQLLANTVIERYRFTIEESDPV
jgi:phosphoribosylformylglycinamidine synthase